MKMMGEENGERVKGRRRREGREGEDSVLTSGPGI